MKKSKQLPDTSQNAAASDDEQIRRINFQHTLQMMHKEQRGGLFPEGEEEESKGHMLTSTAPQSLGISLLQASVANRTSGEVNKQSTTADHQKPINYKHLDWAFREFMKIQEDMIQRGQIDTAIKNLEEALNERLALYPAKDEGVWKIT